MILEEILKAWGHEIVTAENGQQAWDLLQRENIKFMIADWMMPGMDGLSLCRKIRSENAGYVYFILLTGKEGKENIVKGLDAGADDYLTKPFNREELRVRVRTGERLLGLERELTEKNAKLLSLNEKLEELACVDPLMDIGNRRSFYTSVEKTHYGTCRYMHGYGIIMCDIDNFKAYNDTYGHLSGDNVLKAVAGSIKSSLRTTDEVFRYGGEEVVIILPDQDLSGALDVGERIRKEIEALGIEHKGSGNGILTISCGVSAFDVERVGEKWESVLDRADKALYRAKSTGRNRVGT